MITFKLEEEGRKVELSIDTECPALQELFLLWVDFASGCGFVIDKVEMERMWAGEELKGQAETAEQLIYFIANDRPELSHEKVLCQRNEYIKICREWLDGKRATLKFSNT